LIKLHNLFLLNKTVQKCGVMW